ncbi:sensor histidine kinase [Hahella ganghwensis]|uniref:sensor histidine kinase n=1 Tax=Hahella ganghwensis TaxID=286420 RepID=UPI00037DAA54|nr:HAMP domain-containing sensor histidine kinase [Hahella ganghwensis]
MLDTPAQKTFHEKETQSASQATSNFDQVLIHSLSLPGAIFNSEGRLLASNPTYQALLPDNQLLSSLPLLLDDFQCLIPDNWSTAGEIAQPFPWDIVFPTDVHSRSSGRSYTLNGARYTMNGEQRFLLIIEDRSAQISVQRQKLAIHEQLLQTARSLSVGEMATVLAHELNQPLGAIHNYLSTAHRIAGRENASQQVCDAIQLASQQALQAAEVISRIREFVQAREPKFSECSPASLLERPLSMLQIELNSQRIKVIMDFPEDLPLAVADQVMVEQVFANLIRNAIEAMDKTPIERRVLRISSAYNNDHRIEFRVSDEGSGISEEYQHKVFNPFFSTKNNGMGAGLAICRSIIELHGGRLYFESFEDRPGSTFVCTLPSAE